MLGSDMGSQLPKVMISALGAALIGAGAATAQPLQDRLDALGGMPCTDSDFTCVTLQVPRDHRGSVGGSLGVTFGILPATRPSDIYMVVSTGGPGSAGLALADSYVHALDGEFRASVNFIFFDQRGTGPDSGVTCPETEAAYYFADPAISRPDEAIELAGGYAQSCLEEYDRPELVPYLGTDQAIRDLEQFRKAIGGPDLWVYGESYGTQFAQDYARAFPQALAGVILDGVVDLSLTAEEFYAAYALAAEDILDRVLASCDSDALCSAEMGAPAAEVYTRLQGALDRAPELVAFPLGSGSSVQRALTASMFETIAFSALYGQETRADFLRALAAWGNGNPVQMVRLGYATLGYDSEDLAPWYDPSWFGPAFYAINCLDYGPEGADAEEASRRILAEAAEFRLLSPRLSLSYMTERLVCAWWPYQGPDARPARFAGGDYPLLILNGDADPITPVSMAYDIFDAASGSTGGAWMIVQQGGPHVIWGRGNSCPDRILQDLVVSGVRPSQSLQTCAGELTTGYLPLGIPDPDSPFDVAAAVESEIDLYPEVYNWYGDEPLWVGCDHGGRFELRSDDLGWDYRFESCALWSGIVLDGAARWQDGGGPKDGFALNVRVSGESQGQISYRDDDWTGAEWVTGTWNGTPVSTPRSVE